jgi:hypothetical protein
MTTVENWNFVLNTILNCPYSLLSDMTDEKIILWIIDSIDPLDKWELDRIKERIEEKIGEANRNGRDNR